MYKPEELIGQKVKSWGRTLSEAEFALLVTLSWGVAHLHTDAEYMKGTRFGERILPGPLVLSLVVGLAASTGVRNFMLQCEWKLIGIVGFENIRLVGALKPGDTLWVETEFKEWRSTSKESRKLLVLKYDAFKQKNEKVLEGTQLVLFEKP
jgi:3-hydroxybutyryl-CoA dehydratase